MLTTSLKLSKRLKELGVKQKSSEFYYGDNGERIPALNTDELLEILPARIEEYSLRIFKKEDGIYGCMYDLEACDGDHFQLDGEYFEDKNPAEALGLMLEHLLINKLI